MYFKGTGESTLAMDSPVLLMHHDPDRSWITDPEPDHPKGMQPKCEGKFLMTISNFAQALATSVLKNCSSVGNSLLFCQPFTLRGKLILLVDEIYNL